MSHLIRFEPTDKPPPHASQVIIKDQSLLADIMRLANLYQLAFPDYTLEISINSLETWVDTAFSFFCMIEDQYFPLEHMWEWDDLFDNYEETIKPWLTQIPVKVVGLDWELDPVNIIEPKALLVRLEKVGNYSDVAMKHKQMLRYQYPGWEWDGLLNTFRLSQVISTLDEMILPPPFDKLPALVKYMAHESNTYFLDYTVADWPHHIIWNKFNLDWLKDDWNANAARKILDQADYLTNWLIKNPQQLEKVWTILKIAHHRRDT
ncbi:MAG: hypothetical protein ACPGWR_02455 [Ardenticatenaceae bacterium]